MAPATKGLEISKSCSACGKIKDREGFGKKQWAARAVRRCVACVESGVKVVFCDHGRGRDCAVCDAAAAASAAAAAAAHLEKLAEAEEARLEKIRARPQRMLLRRVCDVCLRFFRERRLPVCGGCGKRRYCSVECQTHGHVSPRGAISPISHGPSASTMVKVEPSGAPAAIDASDL